MAALDVGGTVPVVDMPLNDVGGNEWTLAGALADGPVLLGLYKSSCAASKTMFPFLQRLHERYGPRGLRVLGLSQDSENITRSFARRSGLTFPILLDPEDYPVSRAFDITATPTVYLIDPDGTVTATTMGFFADPVNDLAVKVAEAVGAEPEPVYTEADAAGGTPRFVPG
ncbi:MAG: TlpA disulfide reductase family protein [Thermomicrobiales bacterium]